MDPSIAPRLSALFCKFDRRRASHPWLPGLDELRLSDYPESRALASNWRMDHRVSEDREDEMTGSGLFPDSANTEGGFGVAVSRYFRDHLCVPAVAAAGARSSAYASTANTANRIPSDRISPNQQLLHLASLNALLLPRVLREIDFQLAFFDALNGFFEHGDKDVGLSGDRGRAAIQLRRALCNQQTDARLNEYWFSRISDRQSEWSGERRTELMDAWRGVLWLTELNAGTAEDGFATLSRTLVALHDTVADQAQGVGLLKLALHRLEQTCPSNVRSRGLIEALRPYWKTWPQLLKDAALLLWPGLEPRPLAEMPPLPPELGEVWRGIGARSAANSAAGLSLGWRCRRGAVLHRTGPCLPSATACSLAAGGQEPAVGSGRAALAGGKASCHPRGQERANRSGPGIDPVGQAALF